MFKSLLRRRRTTASARRQLFAALLVALLSLPFIPAQFGNVIRTAEAISPDIVISQVYGGGGNTGATYTHDFVELFNRGSSAVSLAGKTVQYTSATGTGNFAIGATLSGTLQPGQYYLVQMASNASVGSPLPTPDATGNSAMAAGAGKVAVVNSASNLPCNGGSDPCTAGELALIVDLVGYGGANFFEGAGPAPAISATLADFRAAAGCTDTDNNNADFSSATPAPRNTSTALNPCSAPTPTPPPGVTLSVNNVSQNEGSGGGTTAFTFTVSLSAPAGPGGVTFDIATADGTAQDDNPATEDNDYAAQSLTGQTIPAGSSTYSFTVQVNADSVSEPNETFFVNVTNVVGATVADGQGLGTIVNDDITLVLIHDVQGNGAASPVVGATVSVRGVVTLLKTNGFFLQEEVGDNDADPNTSEGIFVFTSAAPTVGVADQVTVTGSVVEFNGLTEISASNANVSVNSTGNTLPTAVTLTTADLPPTADPAQSQLEKYEGMRLTAPSLTTVSPNDGFFDVSTVITGVPRPLREPGIPASDPVPPDPGTGTPDCCIPRWDENPERLLLDTNGRAGSTGETITSNVVITNVAGPLDYAFGQYRLVNEAALTRSANMSAIPVPTPTASEFTVAGYNIENFNNNATQREKASLTIRNVLHYPDIIGAIEIFDLASLQALAADVNADAVAAGDPDPMYEARLIPTPVAGITQNVGFLVKTARVRIDAVTQERTASTYVRPSDGATDETHDRPPLVLRATVEPTGANRPVVVVVNHTRSFIDVELVAGDGPNARAKRKAQAEDIAGLFQELQTNNPGVPVIAVGDYNAFQFTSGYDDPVNVMKGNPPPDDQVVVDQSPDLVNPNFYNLIDDLPASERYSFIFEHTAQALDHHLVNTAARARNTRTAIARVNADFPEVAAAVFASNASRPERNSDHDPVVSYYSLAQGQAAGTLIISEFRFRGPNSAGTGAPSLAPDNEFVEVYNNTDADITVQTLDGSEGYGIVASDGTLLVSIPNGTVIPARGHWLGTNANGYTLADYGGPERAQGNDSWIGSSIPDDGGVALFRTANPVFFTADDRLDAAGYTTAPALYREGAGLPTGGPEFDEDVAEWSFFRDFRAAGGRPVDTGNNAADFLGVSTDGAGTALGQRLGAPGPENLNSPIERNGFMQLALLDSTKAAAAPPNRTRDFTSDPGNNSTHGTLSIRRRVVNNTGQSVTELRFRIINITTFPPPAGTADLRARTSTTATVSDIMDAATCSETGDGPPPCNVTVEGTVLEQPPAQPSGGGWNSTLRVPVSLAPGESVNVHFLLGIQQTGAFRFYINTEVVTGPVPALTKPATGLPAARGVRQKATSR